MSLESTQPLMTAEELCEIEARLSNIGPAPWKSYVEGRDFISGSSFIAVGEGQERKDDIELVGASASDQDFIASARQDIPRLLSEIRRLRKALEALS